MSTVAPIVATFGQRLAERRTELGMSRRALGRRLGVTHVTVGYWESDRYLPEAGTLPRIGRELNVSTGTIGRWLDSSPLVTLEDYADPDMCGYLVSAAA